MSNVVFAWKARGVLATFWGIVQDFRASWALTFGRGQRLSEEWLRTQLVPMGFNSENEQTAAYLNKCIWNLNQSGMFWEGQTARYFADKATRRELDEIYRGGPLQRAGQGARLDADGYTLWGPMLHRAHPLVREDMRAFLVDCIRISPEARRVRREKGWE